MSLSLFALNSALRSEGRCVCVCGWVLWVGGWVGEQQSEVCVSLYFALDPALHSEGRCVCVCVLGGWMGGCASEWGVSVSLSLQSV